MLQRRIERAEDRARRAINICDEFALPLWRDRSRLIHGWALAQGGQYELSLTDLATGIADLHTRQSILVVPMLGVAAEAQALAGDWDGSIVTIAAAFANSEPGRDTVWMPDLHRIRAFVLLRGQRPARDQAEADLVRAVELARGQRAKLGELRAATALARLWEEQGRGAEASDLLAPIYGWFTEGFDTPDLKEAQRLLDLLPRPSDWQRLYIGRLGQYACLLSIATSQKQWQSQQQLWGDHASSLPRVQMTAFGA